MRNINQRLVQITPGWTLDFIKGVCKSKRYKELLASLQREADSSELIERIPAPDCAAPNVIPDSPTQGDPVPNVDWAVEVRDVIDQLGIPDGIDLDAIIPGSPTTQTREMIDEEYAWWLPPLAGLRTARPPSRATRAPRVRTGQPARNAGARHRAAYTRMQRLFKRSRKCCARNVLSGTWEEEPSPVPMAFTGAVLVWHIPTAIDPRP